MKPGLVGHAMRRRFGGIPGSAYEMANAPEEVKKAVANGQKYSGGVESRPHIEDWRVIRVEND